MADASTTRLREPGRDDHTAGLLLEVFEAVAGWPMGCVTRRGEVLRLPRTCLQLCLNGQPENVTTHGCAWLQARVAGEPCGPTERRVVCAQGRVAEAHVQADGATQATVFSVGAPEPAPGPSEQGSSTHLATKIAEHLNEVANITEVLVQREEENIRMAEEVLQCYEQLNILYEVTRAFMSASGADELYRIALMRVGETLGADVSFLFDEDGELVSVYEVEGATGRVDRDTWVSVLRGRGSETINRVLFEGMTHVVQDEAEDHIAGLPGPLLLVPLVTSEKVLGVAAFGRERNPTPFRTGEQSMAEAVLGHTALNVQVYRLFDDLQQMAVEVVRAMVNAIDAKDNYTGGHSERVARWSRFLGERLGLSGGDLQMLEWGALLHDIGKIGTRESILGKAGSLTPEEFEHIKQHPVTSYEVLRPIHHLAPVLPGVRHHHESWNGSGYPDGLAGEDIPLFARVIQTADVFDALTSNRSYRRAYTVDQALAIMQNDAGVRLDRRMVDQFAEVIREVQRGQPELLAHVPTGERVKSSSEPDAGGEQ